MSYEKITNRAAVLGNIVKTMNTAGVKTHTITFKSEDGLSGLNGLLESTALGKDLRGKEDCFKYSIEERNAIDEGIIVKLDENEYAHIYIWGNQAGKEKKKVDIVLMSEEETKAMAESMFKSESSKILNQTIYNSDNLKDIRNIIEKARGLEASEIINELKEIENVEDNREILEDIFSTLSKEDLKNPKVMLNMIKIFPNILEIFEEKEDIECRSLLENKTFINGLVGIYRNLLVNSEMYQYDNSPKSFREARFRDEKCVAKYKATEDSPIKIFEDRMSGHTSWLMKKIIGSYIIDEEHPHLTHYERSELLITLNSRGIYDAYQQGLEYAKKKNIEDIQKPISTEEVGRIAAENTRTEKIQETTVDIKGASKEIDRGQPLKEGHDPNEPGEH